MNPKCKSMTLFESYCCRNDLQTYDPYDVWKTDPGFWIKNLFNNRRGIGLLPAALLTVFDLLNHRIRLFYRKQEYPIVRALSALILLNLYEKNPKGQYLEFARNHLTWLAENYCRGYKGIGWGLNFCYAVAKDLHYDDNTPFSTMTPYCLEAFVAHEHITGDMSYEWIMQGIYSFFQQDIQVMYEDDNSMATSYVPMHDRIVTNATSYTMYSLAILLNRNYYYGKNQIILQKIGKLFKFIATKQLDDGSWYYSSESNPFIDCFHSCIILKNVIKTSRLIFLPDADECISRGYLFLKKNLFDHNIRLFRRFAITNKPGIIKYDLYDNAEMLNLSYLLGDTELSKILLESISSEFCQDNLIYSQIDIFGRRRNPGMLRWAIMPYLYALSHFT
jgi:hypothetical protein